MSLEVKSIDEELTKLADIYDGLIAPKKIWRNNNNKLYLLLRAIAAGNVGLNNTAIALRNRFDPLQCDDDDLYSLAQIAGMSFLQGKGSLLDITAVNNGEGQKTLTKGRYRFQAPSGMDFIFEILTDTPLNPSGGCIVTAISREKGVFSVNDMASIKPFREDGTDIDAAFSFSCADNCNQLGYADETPLEFRTRVLNGTQQLDGIKRLEQNIKNLPTIFECNVILNDNANEQEYDGIVLKAKELLIVITGVPTDDLARAVCETVVYDTHLTDPAKVVWYENELYINGRRPVYFTNHRSVDFSLRVHCQYSLGGTRTARIEAAIRELFKPYKMSRRHIDMFGEKDAYKIISALNIPDLTILNIDVVDADGEVVPFIRIPKTGLPNLTDVLITLESVGGDAV